MQTPCLWLVTIFYHCGLYTYTIITPRSSLRLHKAPHPPERKKKRKTWTTFMPVQVKKKKGEEWKMLEYHWGFTFLLHLHMTRVMDLLTTMRHYVCICKMNVWDMRSPLPKLHILLVRNRVSKVRFESDEWMSGLSKRVRLGFIESRKPFQVLRNRN